MSRKAQNQRKSGRVAFYFMAACLLPLPSCLLPTPRERIRIERLALENFPAKARAADVEILPKDPSKPFVSIARIHAQGVLGSSMTALLEEIQEQAAALGADALIRLKAGTRLYAGTGQSASLQQDYGLEAPIGSVSSSPISGSQAPWATALAIRYLDEGGKR